MRTVTRLVTAAAVVVGYVAALLTIFAGIDLREAVEFDDAPAHLAAFRQALDRADDSQVSEEYLWFADRAPSRSSSRASISLATGAAHDGEFDLATRFVGDVEANIEEDRSVLHAEAAASWGRAVPWLVVGAILAAIAVVLRRRQRRANAEVVALVSHYVPPRPAWRRPVFMVVTGIGYTLLVVGFLAVVAATRANELPWAARGVILIIGVIALPIAYYVLRYSRPRSAKGAAETLRDDSRKPVLYLRGFGDDPDSAVVDELPGALSAGLLSVHTREEQLIGALGAFGPVIAVGRPGEQLPHLGAARFYLPGDDWQPGVLKLMELSQLIVLRLGEGDGLWWEVDQARATQPPGKLVLLMPGGRPDLAERLDEHLPTPAKVAVTDDRWTTAVIVFDRDWTPRVQPVGPFPGERNRYGAPAFYVARAMQKALREIGSRRRAMGYRINSRMLVTYGKVLLLVPALFLVAGVLRLIFLW
ncbi:hypothetical protein [Lentzea flava]|uniref:hypothetical protein n=1 Tax=Lentzea flava TaxID=103732 RepID=UPI0020A4B471|nr:hypothetical protein [Lentzea flava]MCP2202203.1 hypothetical protein [Lentzea flava]